MINVLIVEDSQVDAELLSHILSSDRDIKVIAVASTGLEALKIIDQKRPDVVTMDINIPGMDGFETARVIMEKLPLPIVIVSSSYKKENVSLSFRAMEAGALTIIEKPAGIHHPDYEKHKVNLIRTVKLMSEIKVVSRRNLKQGDSGREEIVNHLSIRRNYKVIAIGASTGGPPVLMKLLKEMNGIAFPPVLLVQHMAVGFTKGFAEWLADTTGLNVKLPVNGEKVQPSTVYVAPDNNHMGVSGAGRIILDSGPVIKSLRPAVSFLFRSVSESYGDKAIGILLTGMGADGSQELKLMRDKGALTFAQDEESSVVFGMPGEAVKLGGAVFVLPPESIAVKIKEILK